MFDEQVYRGMRVATRYYPSKRFASKFSRALGWMMKTAARGPVWARAEGFANCPPLELDLSNRLQRKIYLFPRGYANYYLGGPLSQLLRRELSPGHVFIDIGSNLGWFSILAAQLVGGKGRALAFEPDPVSYESIVRSTRLNALEQRLTAFNMALSAEDGEMALHRDPRGLRSSLVTATRYAEVLSVPVSSLDAMAERGELGVDRIDLIKVDVEGQEPSTIRGLLGVLARFDRPMLWCEVRGPNGSTRAPDTLTPVKSMMEGLGYSALKFDGTSERVLLPEDIAKSGSQDVLFTVDG